MNRRRAISELTGLGLLGASVLPSQNVGRPFRMGFTPFPPTPKSDDWLKSFQVAGRYGDVIALFVQDGVPWEEASAGLPVSRYPKGIREFLEFQLQMINVLTPNHARYIAFNPISTDYRQLAASWTTATNEPLQYPWNSYDFDHPSVKRALLNHLRALVDFFMPTYLNIGIETNILMARNYEFWPTYLELHRYLYTELKKQYPRLPVFTSFQYEHLLGLHGDSARLRDRLQSTNPDVLLTEARRILAYSDILAISTYPHLVENLQIDQSYFQPAVQLASEKKIPLAIDQTGFSSVPLRIQSIALPGSEALQQTYVEFVLQQALAHKMNFVINFISVDYGTSFGEDPVSLAWAYTGLFRPDGTPKPALTAWERTQALRLQS